MIGPTSRLLLRSSTLAMRLMGLAPPSVGPLVSQRLLPGRITTPCAAVRVISSSTPANDSPSKTRVPLLIDVTRFKQLLLACDEPATHTKVALVNTTRSLVLVLSTMLSPRNSR